jgi:putative transposase
MMPHGGSLIKYTAESAGTYAIAVNPGNTSNICPGYGRIAEKKIYSRSHNCTIYGLALHRDLNASLNILRLGTDPMKEGFARLHQSHII